jgi:subtilase family serine protease
MDIETEQITPEVTPVDSLISTIADLTPETTVEDTPGIAVQGTPVATIQVDTAPSGADLVVYNMILMMAGQQGNCVNKYTPYGIRVVIENQGHGDANTFWVGVNEDLIQVEQGLAAGQSLALHFSGTVPSGRYTATVDVFDQVKELNEDNNLETFLAPTPTPLPICTPSPTP